MKKEIKQNKPAQEKEWEAEWDNMFDWAEQIKEEEIGRWKLLYGFTPDDLKSFIRTLLEDQQGELYAWFNKALLKQKQEIEDKEFKRRRTAKIKTAEAGGEMCELRLKKQKQEIIEMLPKQKKSQYYNQADYEYIGGYNACLDEIIKRLTP